MEPQTLKSAVSFMAGMYGNVTSFGKASPTFGADIVIEFVWVLVLVLVVRLYCEDRYEFMFVRKLKAREKNGGVEG